MKLYFLPLSALLFFTGCFDTSDKSNASVQQTNDDTPVTVNKTLSPGGELVNGYVLPPEPDPAINNATVLGVDANNNGVRDDVERWIITRYQDKHKIVTEAALQEGRAFQIVLADPSNAEETVHVMHAALDCMAYFVVAADEFGDPILMDVDTAEQDAEAFENMVVNTTVRVRAYGQYNSNLSGGVYTTTWADEMKAKCDFNTTKLLQDAP